MSQTEHLLATLEGVDPSSVTLPDIALSGISLPHDLPVSLPSDLVRQRPDILSAEARLHVASANIGVAAAAMFPRCSLNTTYGMAGSSAGNLLDALEKARKGTSRLDLAIMLFVGVVVNVGGFVEGALAGTVITSLIFLVKYSKIDFVKQSFNNRTVPSRITRSDDSKRLLLQADWLMVYVLEGFVFFGSAQQLYQRIKHDFRQQEPVVCIIDFAHVKGLDATAVSMLGKLGDMLQAQGGRFVASGARGKLLPLRGRGVRLVKNLDLAIQFAEDARLASAALPASVHPELPLLAQLADYVQTRSFSPGSLIIRQGDAAAGLLLILAGSVRVALPDGNSMRLRKFMSGTILGEISLYTGGAAVASVYANEATRALLLSPDALARLECDAPGLAMRLHKLVATVIAQRLTETNRSLQHAIA